ncbi:MAG: alpha/beta hydrolase [Burkholderiales bacterium]|nr:alpha/beta hydrolase [Burkholderiales bacterium]
MVERLHPGRAREAEAAPELAAYDSGYVSVDGLRLHYLDYGSAGRPPMLCVHGGAAHAHWFDFVAAGFTADYHVRALDLRGHGDSDWAKPPLYSYPRYADDIAEAVDRLGLEDFVLVGHSMGGTISLLYAATHPGRVARLIVIDSTLRMTEERIANLRNLGAREGSRYASREEFLHRFRLRPHGKSAAPHILRHLANCSAREFPDGSWRHKFDRDVYARREPIDGLPLWSRIKIPALLVKGEASARITPEIAAQVKANCAHVVIAEVPGAEHHVTIDNPAGFVRVASEFLREAKP